MENVLIYNLNIAGQLRALPGQCCQELDRLCSYLLGSVRLCPDWNLSVGTVML
jgi:hypothetical protein